MKLQLFSEENAQMVDARRRAFGLFMIMLDNPATLSIIAATFPPHQRGTEIGLWAGVSALQVRPHEVDRRVEPVLEGA